jgi:flavin-binding protein dodecin
MKEHIYKNIEITGSSDVGTDEAIRKAILRASETIKNMDWFKVVEVRGQIGDGKVHYWQATVKIGFRLED